MSNNPGTLSDEDVRQITLLVETLDRSTFDYLQVELGALKVTLGKGAPPDAPVTSGAPLAAAAAVPAMPATAAVMTAAVPPLAQTGTAVGRIETPAHEGTVAVVAPTLGRFYASPEPGAPPFVSVGAEVGPDTTVALIEVMKMFTAVCAGVHGVVTEACVQNEQFVEYGQILFRVRPTARPAEIRSSL